MKTVNVGKEYFYRLVNRDKNQGDGRYTAEEFRLRYLSELDNTDIWNTDGQYIVLDFVEVEKIGPSFANEAFAYFTKYTTIKKIKEKIQFINITRVKSSIINEELESGYNR